MSTSLIVLNRVFISWFLNCICRCFFKAIPPSGFEQFIKISHPSTLSRWIQHSLRSSLVQHRNKDFNKFREINSFLAQNLPKPHLNVLVTLNSCGVSSCKCFVRPTPSPLSRHWMAQSATEEGRGSTSSQRKAPLVQRSGGYPWDTLKDPLLRKCWFVQDLEGS